MVGNALRQMFSVYQFERTGTNLDHPKFLRYDIELKLE